METVDLAYDVYESPGSEKCPIIFLHGLFWNKHMLRDLADALHYNTKRTVFCLDLRCHDKSPFREECNSTLMAEDIKRFIEKKCLKKVAFVCHSFSCTVAYFVAVDEPEAVEKIVMIDHLPYAQYTDSWYKETVCAQFAAQNRFLNTLDPSSSLCAAKRKILDMKKFTTDEGQRIFLEKVAYELTKVDNKFDWKTNHKFLFERYRERFWPTPRGRSDHEILVIRAQDSTRVPDEKFASNVKYNPNIKLKTIKDCTHLLMFEKDEEFVEAVKEFLS